MRKWKILICCILLVVFSAGHVLAHPGRTDENGGHYNRSTGEYHYHHGYPEHQHTDGICPYDFDDKTGESSGSSANTQQKDNSEIILETNKNEEKEPGTIGKIIVAGFLIFLGILFINPLLLFVYGIASFIKWGYILKAIKYLVALIVSAFVWLLVFEVFWYLIGFIGSIPILGKILYLGDVAWAQIVLSASGSVFSGAFCSAKICGNAKLFCWIVIAFSAIFVLNGFLNQSTYFQGYLFCAVSALSSVPMLDARKEDF